MGGAANDGDWINTVEPLAGLADFNLTSDQQLQNSWSHLRTGDQAFLIKKKKQSRGCGRPSISFYGNNVPP